MAFPGETDLDLRPMFDSCVARCVAVLRICVHVLRDVTVPGPASYLTGKTRGRGAETSSHPENSGADVPLRLRRPGCSVGFGQHFASKMARRYDGHR